MKALILTIMMVTGFSAHAAKKMTRIDCRDISSDKDSKPKLTVFMDKGTVRRTLLHDETGKTLIDKNMKIEPLVRWGSPYELYQIPQRKETFAVDQSYKKTSEEFHGFLLWGNADKTPINNPQIIDSYVCNKSLQTPPSDKPALPTEIAPSVELGKTAEINN